MNSKPLIARHSPPPIPFSVLMIFALVLFSALAAVLFRPSLGTFRFSRWLVPFNSVAAAAGCFLLSRRWLASFDASAIAGAVYGFGPFVLSFKIYHPLAGFGVALLPWLFCPVALWDRYAPSTAVHTIRRLILLLVPFAGMILFFWLPAQPWLGPHDLMPRTQQFQSSNLLPLLGFPGAWGKQIILGLYANTFILALMGLFVYLAVLRVTILIPVLIGILLSFFQPIFHVPPVVWLAIPMLFLSILAGLGAQAFAWAGASDRSWILLCMTIAALLGGVCLFQTFFGQNDTAMRLPAIMYGVAFLLTGTLFFLARGQLRWHLFRWILIGTAAGVDLFFTGRMLLSRIG